MWRSAVRNLLGHKLRLAATGLAVTLGVAFLAGTLTFNATMSRTFDDLFASVYRGTDAVVRAEAAFEDPNGFAEQRGRVDEALVGLVEEVAGVASAQGDIFGYAQIVDRDGEPLGNPQAGAPTIGGNWPSVAELNPWTLVSGRAPRADDEVVIDEHSAVEAGYAVGDSFPVLVKGGPQTVRLVGIVRFGTAASPGGASFVNFTTPAAQRFVGEPGRFDSVSVVGEVGLSQAAVVERVGDVLPDGVEAITGEAITKENQDAIQRGLSFFNSFMLVFAVVGLIVGGYIIFNTFSITVAQRTREHGLLRALGAGRGQILAAVLLEATGVGLVSCALGIGLGVLVAGGLKAMLSAFGLEMPAGGIVFTARTALISLVAGMVVTLLAATSPARQASRISPMAALRNDAGAGARGRSRRRLMVGFAVLASGVAALFAGLFGDLENALPVVGTGALGVFFGVTLLGELVSAPLSRAIGWPLPRLRGITGRLARENATRNPKRTAATASALMIGVGLVGFITIFAASAKSSFSAIVDANFRSDFMVTSPAAFGMGGLDPAVAAAVRARPEVALAGSIRGGVAEVGGTPVQIMGADQDAFTLVDVGPVAGRPADLVEGTIAVHEDAARKRHLEVGSRVPVVFKDTGLQHLRVAMIYKERQPAGSWLLGFATWDPNFADHYDYQILVKAAPGVRLAEGMRAVRDATAEFPGAGVFDRSGYKADQTKLLDQLLGLIYALLMLAVVIALLGIGNTLALSILERRHELGLMRAVGMTRAQVRGTIRWESVIIALQGALLGLVVGLLFGWSLVRAMADDGLGRFSLPGSRLAVVLVLAVFAGVVAALLPARRAARLDILRAIASD